MNPRVYLLLKCCCFIFTPSTIISFYATVGINSDFLSFFISKSGKFFFNYYLYWTWLALFTFLMNLWIFLSFCSLIIFSKCSTSWFFDFISSVKTLENLLHSSGPRRNAFGLFNFWFWAFSKTLDSFYSIWLFSSSKYISSLLSKYMTFDLFSDFYLWISRRKSSLF